MTDRPEAFVLIHGAHHGSWVWDPLLAHLRLPTLAVDLPGRGARPADLRSLTLDDYAVAVAADIHAAGLRRVILVGHSLAGSVAYTVAARNPNAVTHLVGSRGRVSLPWTQRHRPVAGRSALATPNRPRLAPRWSQRTAETQYPKSAPPPRQRPRR